MELERQKQVQEKEKNLRTEVDKFKLIIQYLKNINYNPDNVIKKLATGNELGLTDDIAIIEKGLHGQFTRDKSIELAKTKLFTLLISNVEDIKIKLDEIELKNFINNLSTEAESLLEYIEREVNVEALLQRKDMYSRNSATLEYFRRKLSSSLDSKIGEFGARTESDILFCFREIIAMIALNDLTDIKKIALETEKKKELIMYNYSKIKEDDFRSESLEYTQLEELTRANEIIPILIEKVDKLDKAEEDPIDIISGIIERTSTTLEVLRKNLTEIITMLNTLTSVESSIEQVLVNTLNNVIVPYLKDQTITVEEFNKLLERSYITLENLLVIAKEQRTIILNTFVKYVNNLSVFETIYKTIDEITLKGTLPDTTVTKQV